MKHYLLIAAILVAGCYRPPSPGPGPTPTPSGIEGAAQRCMDGYPERLAATYEGLAADLDAGRFSSANGFADELEKRAKECRENAFAEFRTAWGNTDNWSASSDAEKCRASARGFRK